MQTNSTTIKTVKSPAKLAKASQALSKQVAVRKLHPIPMKRSMSFQSGYTLGVVAAWCVVVALLVVLLVNIANAYFFVDF